MKIKYMIIVSLILAIMTIGAVSASQDFISDDGNLTASTEDSVEISSEELDDLIADDDVGDEEGLITDYDYSVDMNDEFLVGRAIYGSVSLPEDASGTASVTIDDNSPEESEIYDGRCYFYWKGDLERGSHNCLIRYAGDDKYAGFDFQKTFFVRDIVINLPDEIDRESGDFSDTWTSFYGNVAGEITIKFDNITYKTGLIEDLRDYADEDSNGVNMYYIPIILDYLSFGPHDYEIIYTVGGETVRKTGSFNLTYYLGTGYYTVPYGEDTIKVRAPIDAMSNVIVTLNGKSFEYKLNGDSTEIPLTNMVFGANNLTLTYSDDKYPLKTVKQVLNVKGVFKAPYGTFDYKTDEVISLTLPEDSSGNMVIYKIIYDLDTWEATEKLIATVPIDNGYASYSIKNLGLGDHSVAVKYENGSSDVDDITEDISIFPVITYERGVKVGQDANFTIEFPDGANGDLVISIFECDEDGYGSVYDSDPVELYNGQVSSNEISLNLNSSKAGFYKILFNYNDENITLDNEYNELRFNVHDVDENQKLEVDFPSVMLQGKYVTIPINYPKGADGRIALYVDGSLEADGGANNYESELYFNPYFSIGTHKWEIYYYDDSYFIDSYQNGTFEIVWAEVPKVLEIGGNTLVEVNLKGGSGTVKIKIDGADYMEENILDNHATFDLAGVSQGNHTYEITYGDLVQSGSFEMSYAIDVRVDGSDYVESIKFSKSNEIEISIPDATGSFDVIHNGKLYTGNFDSYGAGKVYIPLNWGENTLTIRFNGDETYAAKEIQKTLTVCYGNIIVNSQNGIFTNASLSLPYDAEGNLSIFVYGYKEKSVPFENGIATIDTEGLPTGCYYVRFEYGGGDYLTYGHYTYISIPPEINITNKIKEGDDCIIEIELPDSSSNVDIYVDGEMNTSAKFEDGRLYATISDLSLGTHTITFTYKGYDYETLFKYYDEDVNAFYPIEYTVKVKQRISEPNFNITIADIEEGEPVDVKVTADEDFTGWVIVKINDSDVLVYIENGKGSNSTDLYPPIGNYSATLDFAGNEDFNEGHAKTTFNVTAKEVTLQSANLAIEVSDIDLGGAVTIYISINENATKNVTVKVSEYYVPLPIFPTPAPDHELYNETFEVVIVEGRGNVTIPNLTNSAKYNVVATYAGDEIVAEDEITDSFKVLEDADLDMTVPEFIYENETFVANITMKNVKGGDTVKLSIELDPKVDGVFPIDFASITYNSNSTTWTVSGLTKGNYTLKAIFEGNDYYKPANITKTFEVKETLIDPELEILPIEDVYVGSDVNISFTIHRNATGNVTIYVGDKNCTVTLSKIYNGTYVRTFSGLKVGTYEVRVSYTGGGNEIGEVDSDFGIIIPSSSFTDKVYNFAPSNKTASFRVKPIPVSPELNVTADEIYEGQNATITVTINNRTTGKVSINVNGEAKLIDIVNGIGRFTIPALDVGEHTFEVSFEGDEYYLAESKNVTVKVKVHDVRIELVNIINEYRAGNFLFKVVNNTDGSAVANVTVRLITSGNIGAGFSAKTDENGIASFKTIDIFKFVQVNESGNMDLRQLELTVGNHLVELSIDNANISAGKVMTNLTILPAHIKIVINPYEEYYGSEKLFEINVTNSEGEAFTGSAFKISIPQLNYEGYVYTNGSGIAAISLKNVVRGTYDITVSNNDTQNIINTTQAGNFTIKPLNANFTANASDVYVGENATIDVTIAKEYEGFIMIKIGDEEPFIIADGGKGSFNLGALKAGEHTFVVRYDGDLRYDWGNRTVSFNVIRKNPKFAIEIANVDKNTPITVRVTADGTFTGNVTVNVAGRNVSVSVVEGLGVNTTDITLPIADGYNATLAFEANDEFESADAKNTFNVTKIDPKFVIVISNVETGTPITVRVTADSTFTGNVIVKVNGTDVLVSVVNGVGTNDTQIILPVSNDYVASMSFEGNDEFSQANVQTTFNVTENKTVPAKIVAGDLSAFYNKVSYSVTVYGTDGNVAGNVVVTFKINGKKVGSAKTNAKGIATIKLKQVPKTYKITSEALGVKVTKKLKVKQVLTLKKVKVKRSAKKLVLKATLKEGKKAIKNKKIIFKFKGKKYTAKTNKKGIAKVTVKKSVLKKLKAGKKVTYTATYLKDTVKKTVRVKK